MYGNKNLLSICILVFILTLGTGMVAPIIAPYSLHLGASGFWVGIIYSGFYIVRFVIGTPISFVTDWFGVRRLFIVSMVMYPIIALAYYMADNLLALLGARLLHGIASTMMLPMAMAFVGEISPKGKESLYMGVFNTVLFCANGIGPIIGGSIANEFGYHSSFLGLLIFAICSLLLTLYVLPKSNSFSKIKLKTKNDSFYSEHSRKQSTMFALLSVFFASAVLSMFYVSFLPLYGLNIGLSTFQIGMLLFVFNMTIGIFQIPFGKWADKWVKERVLFYTTIAIGVTLLVFPLMHDFPQLILLAFILSILYAIMLVCSSGISAKIGREYGMGKTMGFVSSATSLGMIVGPLLSGVILDNMSYSWLFVYMSGLWILSGVLQFFLMSFKSIKNCEKVRENKDESAINS